MSKIEVNTVAPQCGTTLTLGESGDTVTLGSGASQSGFGRTGTVDWQTTKKTSDFTAVNGEGYFVDTGSGAVIVTLPASPSAGDIIAVKDYDGNFGTTICTLARNGSNIRGATDNVDLSKNNSGVVCIYVDATEGWQLFFDGSNQDAQAAFICASGGNTTTTCGNFKIHTFTGPGTFTVNSLADNSANDVVDYLVIAGGGGSGGQGGQASGGGGAGGYRESAGTSTGSYTVSPLGACVSALPVSIQGYPITVGAGGAGGSAGSDNDGSAGNPSVFSSITSAAGGYGGGAPGPAPGGNGGSGGGGRNTGTKGTGNTPPVSPPQGQPGGDSDGHSGSGGGGATGAGGDSGGPGGASGNGGVGGTSSINGTPTQRAGGGAGGMSPTAGPSGSNSGGGGPGVGPSGPPSTANATANTGGGAGGVGDGPLAGATGGSGIVIIRYRFK
jgi:hypothetical protein